MYAYHFIDVNNIWKHFKLFQKFAVITVVC